ncbi:MAG: protein YgfX [Pseudomonadota bacterium]
MKMLRLSLSPSRYLAGLLILAHGASIAIVAIIDWPLWFKVLISLGVFASSVFHLQRDALLRSPSSIVAFLLKSDGQIEVTQRNGKILIGQQLKGSFVHPWFTTVLWRAEGARFSRANVILPDSLPAEQFRELRVWLKWRRIEKA